MKKTSKTTVKPNRLKTHGQEAQEHELSSDSGESDLGGFGGRGEFGRGPRAPLPSTASKLAVW